MFKKKKQFFMGNTDSSFKASVFDEIAWNSENDKKKTHVN